jgi:hypothetical protein
MSILNNSINANSNTPLSPTEGGTGLNSSSATAHGILITEGSSAFNPIVLTAGEILIGTTSGDPIATTLTAGTNVTITSISGAITINASGGGGSTFTWNTVSSSPITMVSNNGYVNLSSIYFFLPTTASVGDIFIITSNANSTTISNGRIETNSGQFITFNTQTTSIGGYLQLSTSTTCSGVTLVCLATNTLFGVVNFIGAISIH